MKAGIVLAVLCAAAGSYARFVALGAAPFAVDEYYFAESVDHVLERGVPRFDDGGYYVQALIPQYAAALATIAFGRTETAYRIPALLAGLLTVFLSYRYARIHLERGPAIAVAAAVAVSSWEIELSRFARMYTPLSCATLGFLIWFDRSLGTGEWRRRYAGHAWVAGATLSHMIGALLAPLLLAPLLDSRKFASKRDAVRYGAVTLLSIGAIAAFAAFDFRRWGAPPPLPVDYDRAGTGFLRVPAFPFVQLGADPRWMIAGIAVLLVAAAGVGWRRGRTLAYLAAAGAAAHQFTVTGLALAALALRGRLGTMRDGYVRNILVVSVVAWAGAVAFAGREFIGAAGAGSFVGAIRRTFFAWPDFLSPQWEPWSEDLPVIGAVTLMAVCFLLARSASLPLRDALRGPAPAITYMLLAMGFVQYFSIETRYLFHFYPVALTAMALAARFVFGRYCALAFTVAFALSGDCDPRHIAKAGTPEVTFRRGAFESKRSLWYPRPDYREAAAWLGESRARRSGAPLIFGYCPPLERYTKEDHAIYLERAGSTFYERSRERGTRELWSRKRLLSTPGEILEYTRGAEFVRVVRCLPQDRESLNPERLWGGRVIESTREFEAEDGSIEILYLRLAP